MIITAEFEQRVRVLFGFDSTKIIDTFRTYSPYMITCMLLDNKVFNIEATSQQTRDDISYIFYISFGNLENYVFDISNVGTNRIHISSRDLVHRSRYYNHDRLMEQFVGYVPIFRANIDGYAPRTRLDGMSVSYNSTSSLPTLQIYVRQLSQSDFISLLETANNLVNEIPECVITGNSITGNNTIVVTLSKGLSSTKELKWLLRIYDGSGKKIDKLDAISIKEYLDNFKKDPLTKIDFVSQPEIFSNIIELFTLLNHKTTPKETYCGIKKGFLLS